MFLHFRNFSPQPQARQTLLGANIFTDQRLAKIRSAGTPVANPSLPARSGT
jgi:hypothetical protein